MDQNSNPLGAFTRGSAIEGGWTEGRLRNRSLARPFHGVRAVIHPRTHLERAEAYMPRVRAGQFFSHLTAAVLYGIPLPTQIPEDDPIHVSVFHPARPPRCRGVVGHAIDGGRFVVTQRHGLPVTDAASTWLLLGPLLPLGELVAATDHLLFVPRFRSERSARPFLRREELEAALADFHGNGTRTLRAALAIASDSSASRPETGLRLLIVEAGLPSPVANVPIHVGDRLITVGDLVFPRWKVLVEYDGEQHRTSAAQFARDRQRLLELHLAGWIVVSVRADGLRSMRARTIDEIRAALHAHGWRG